MAAPPTISQLVAKNFRCLRDVTITFAPLTILVGPNASGKSTILEALHYQERKGPKNRWQKDIHTSVILDIYKSAHPYETLATMHGEKTEINKTVFSKFAWKEQLIRLDARELHKTNKPTNTFLLNTFGENLTNLFASLTRKQQTDLVERFHRLVPAIQDINVVPFGDGTLQLRFTDTWNESLIYTPEEVSDGTMFVLAFLCLQYQPAPPDLLLIEEPERGLHPYLMEQVMKLLRALAHGELGPKAVQVVMATHSAELIEYARPEEVRFVNRRREDGATTVYEPPVNDPEWRAIFKEYNESLASMWLSGNMGGVPRGEVGPAEG